MHLLASKQFIIIIYGYNVCVKEKSVVGYV